jgi:hypothetical protein
MTSKFRPGRLDARLIAICLTVALVPAAIKLIYYPHNIGSDDAYIHVRVASEYVRGLGWGINPHEPVNLSTAPAFTLLLATVERGSPHFLGLTQVLSYGAVVAGLLLVFFAALADTASVGAALLAEVTAAFSVNLWRWNGTLMETTFAFAAVAWVLYLLRRGKRQDSVNAAVTGVVSGVGILLRPEMGLLAVLAVVVLVLRSEKEARVRNVVWMSVCVAIPLAGWVAFAHANGISALPTTYAAKSVTGLLLVNAKFTQQFSESVVVSIFAPGLLVLAMVCIGLWRKRSGKQDFASYVLPVGWIAALFVFYYVKMPSLESAGRYLLPLLPCEALLLALLWKRFEWSKSEWQRWGTAGALGLQALIAVAVNQRTIAPVLKRFESEYGTTMRAAAEELARRTAGMQNRRVLVVVDIGLLSCAGDGRFEIFDGKALATPSLRGLDTKAQMEQVQPAFVVQSLSETSEGFEADMPGELHKVWARRFLQHGVRLSNPFYYTILFTTKWSGG